MKGALRCGDSIAPPAFADVVRTMALEHHKWDAQVGDVSALASFPLVLSRAAWNELASTAEALARETVAIEAELAHRPELYARLGVPPALAAALHPRAGATPTPPAARIMRFDFHPTLEGWRISEVNSDVPGGFTESSCFARLIAGHTSDGDVVGDAGAAWIDAIAAAIPENGTVALLSAPGWVEDAQVVAHLASRLRARGIAAHLASPHQLRWPNHRAHVAGDLGNIALDMIVRFYQAEWIATLPRRESWLPLFADGNTPVTNPTSAALTESKRLPLLWSELEARTDAWRVALPETRDPREARDLWGGDWVLKPAYGNTGDHVITRAGSSRSAWYRSVVAALVRPRQWVAQRRFHAIAVDSPRGDIHACIGVYVVEGRAIGAYARFAHAAIIDYQAIDAAVLVEREVV